MSTTKRQQQEFPLGKALIYVLAVVIVVLIIGGLVAWGYGTEQRWYDTGVVLISNKSLASVTDQYPCCSWIHNYTILSDHHGQIVILTGQSGNLENHTDMILHVQDQVAIRQNNNGNYEVFPDP